MQGKISLWAIFISLIFALGIACSNDDGPKGNCFQDEDREIVATFTNAIGGVVGPSDNLCPDLFILTGGPEHPKRFAMHLLPCNLPDNFKDNGLRSFSVDTYMNHLIWKMFAHKNLKLPI